MVPRAAVTAPRCCVQQPGQDWDLQGDLLGGAWTGKSLCLASLPARLPVWEGTEAGSGLGPSLVRGAPFLRAYSMVKRRALGISSGKKAASGQRERWDPPKPTSCFHPRPALCSVRVCAVPQVHLASSAQVPTPLGLSTIFSPLVSAGSGIS